MKKLSVGIIALLYICVSSQALIVTNSSYNKIGSSAGNNYNDFKWDVGSYSDVVLSWSFDQSLTNTTPKFRMSSMTDTGRVIYVDLDSSNSDIAISTTNVTMTLVRTNMPYRASYDTEVSVVDASGYWTSVSRGKLNVTLSLFDPTLNDFSLPVYTNITLQRVLENGNTSDQSINLTGTSTYLTNGVPLDFSGGTAVTVTEGDGVTITTNGNDYTVAVDGTVIRADGSVDFTGDQDHGSNAVTGVKYADFEPLSESPAHQAGRMFYDASTDSWKKYYSSPDITLNDGEELWIPIRNNTGTTITNGQAVYVVGQIGQNQTVGLAKADDATTSKAIAIATMDIPNNSNGKATTDGSVGGLDTTIIGSNGADLYLSATTAGLVTTNPPAAGNYCVKLGKVGVVHASNGNINVNIQPAILASEVFGFADQESDPIARPLLNALPDDRPVMTFIADGVTVTGVVDVTNADGDYIVNFNSQKYTNAVPVSLTLANGTTNTIQMNYVYATTNGITNSTTFPTGEYAMMFDIGLLDAGHSQSDGVFSIRRWTDEVSGPNGQGRSMVQRLAERVRQEPSVWQSGGTLASVVTTQGAANDDVFLTITTGTAYQMHKQTFSAITATNGTQEYHVLNDPNGIAHITNLNQITTDASGNAVLNNNNSYFNVAVLRRINSGTTNDVDGEVLLNLSLDDYASADQASSDASGTLVLSVPVDYVGETIVIGFITLRRISSGSGTWTATPVSLLGTPVGGQGGGSSSLPGATTFTDAAFSIVDDVDPTKIMKFQASGISTATTRTLTPQDRDGVLAYNNVAETFTADVTVEDAFYLGETADSTAMFYFVTTADTNRIQSTATGFDYVLPNTADTHDFVIGAQVAYAFGTTNADFNGRSLTEVGYLSGTGDADFTGTVTGGDLAGDSVTFTTNSTKQFTGTLNTTNYVGWSVGTNSYLLMFDVP